MKRVWPDWRWAGPILVILATLFVQLPGITNPSISYDEAITLLLVGGDSQPEWPQDIESVGELATVFQGSPSPREIVQDLRDRDVHPPVYFILASAWGNIFGRSLGAVRAFSALATMLASLSFLGLLRWGRHPTPVLTSLLFACTSGVVIVGQLARPYGLAQCLVCLAAWCASLAVRPGPRQEDSESGTKSVSWLPAFGSALCCHLAFLCSYLAFFPVCVILLFVMLRLWKQSRLWSVAIPILTGLSWLPWAEFIGVQSISRPGQDVGFHGWLLQAGSLWHAHEMLFWALNHPLRPWVIGAMSCVIVFAWLYLRKPTDRILSWLLLGWALVPYLGLVAMNVVFDKHLAEPRYLVLAAPGILGLLGYALARIRWFPVLGVLFLLLQVGNVVTFNKKGTAPASLSRSLAAAGPDSTLVLIGAGYGNGFPAQMIYELDSSFSALVLDDDQDLEVVEASLKKFREIWLVVPTEDFTRSLENQAFERIVQTGSYQVVEANPAACRLIRIDA